MCVLKVHSSVVLDLFECAMTAVVFQASSSPRCAPRPGSWALESEVAGDLQLAETKMLSTSA